MSVIKVSEIQHPSAVSPAIELESDGTISGFLGTALDSKLPISGGKILQIVRATDSTLRTTTSTTFVDVTGVSVTITPQKSDSAILLILAARIFTPSTFYGSFQITDASNNVISGAQNVTYGADAGTLAAFGLALFAFDTPATISATTYKARFRNSGSGTVEFRNHETTAQMYAIEVSA